MSLRIMPAQQQLLLHYAEKLSKDPRKVVGLPANAPTMTPFGDAMQALFMFGFTEPYTRALFYGGPVPDGITLPHRVGPETTRGEMAENLKYIAQIAELR